MLLAMRSIQDQFDTYNDMNSSESITQFVFFGYAGKAGIDNAEASVLWQKVDVDNSGLVSFAEFRNWAADLVSEATINRLAEDERKNVA